MEIRDLIGIKYTDGGRTKEEGFDCYGIVIEVLRRAGIEMPDIDYETAEDAEGYGKAIGTGRFERIGHLEPLCILALTVNGQPTHCGVYLGEGKMIHSTQREGVTVCNVQRWTNRIAGLYKVKT